MDETQDAATIADDASTPAARRGGSFLDNLAANATLECAVMNGTVHGRDAVIAQIKVVGAFYRDRQFTYSFDFEDHHVEEYTATVAGRPITATATMHYNDAGEIDQVVVNHRPLSAALTFSRLISESAIGEQTDPDRFYRPSGQTYDDLLRYTDRHDEPDTPESLS